YYIVPMLKHSTLVSFLVFSIALILSLFITSILSRQKSKKLQEQQQYSLILQQLIAQNSSLSILLNKNMELLYINADNTQLMDESQFKQLESRDFAYWLQYLPENIRSNILFNIEQLVPWSGEVVLPFGQRERHVSARIAPIKDSNQQLSHLLITCDDISEHIAISNQLFIREHYNVLTGLPNRHYAKESLGKQIQQVRDQGGSFIIMHIDLDRIRYLNDTLGHNIVDKLFCETGARLQRGMINDGRILAHIGADEFLIILDKASTTEEAKTLAISALNLIKKPFLLAEREINITASVGLSKFPADGNDASTLMRRAEAAMFAAKEEGGGRYQFYKKGMSSVVEIQLETESQLRYAIERNEFILHYQPVIQLSDNQLVGVEVLLRWHNDELKNPPPDRFIHIAEKSGLIIPIGAWVLEQACNQAVKWLHNGMPPLRMAVNISAKQFETDEIVGSVRNALSVSGLPPSNLELEVTENLLLNDAAQVYHNISELKKLGVHLSLDDFGTGYASLSYLQRYQFDTLKIDRSFISDIDGSDDNHTLTKAIIAMAHGFNMRVIAEGVETLTQRRALKEQGCDMVQGYLYSPALPADHFEQWAKRYHEVQDAHFI
ncbi:MAG: putative bifunctional diguanylate cyclase/phosphodiesterase, partial [Spongiibacteraceae bacterium]